MSDKDIHSGARWQSEITGRLDECRFGVVIVTPQNQKSSWLQFEAGALSKSVNDARVVPLLVDLRKSDLLLPLNMFQAEILDQSGVQALLTSINQCSNEPLDEGRVRIMARKWWDDLHTELDKIDSPTPERAEPERSERDLLEELVTMVRAMRNTIMHSQSDASISDEALAALRSKLAAPDSSHNSKSRPRRRDELIRNARQAFYDAGIALDSVYSDGEAIQFNVSGADLPSALQYEVTNVALEKGFSASIAVFSPPEYAEVRGAERHAADRRPE